MVSPGSGLVVEKTGHSALSSKHPYVLVSRHTLIKNASITAGDSPSPVHRSKSVEIRPARLSSAHHTPLPPNKQITGLARYHAKGRGMRAKCGTD